MIKDEKNKVLDAVEVVCHNCGLYEMMGFHICDDECPVGKVFNEATNTHMIKVTNIYWDTTDELVEISPEKLDLPTEVTLPVYIDYDVDDEGEAIAGALSDKYGWCVCDFEYEFQEEQV